MVAKKRSSFMIRDILHADKNQCNKETKNNHVSFGGNNIQYSNGEGRLFKPLHVLQEKGDYPRRQSDRILTSDRSNFCSKSSLLQEDLFHVSSRSHCSGLGNGQFDIQCYRTPTIPPVPPSSIIHSCPHPSLTNQIAKETRGASRTWGTLSTADHGGGLGDMGLRRSSSGTSLPSPPPSPALTLGRASHPGVAHAGLVPPMDVHGYRPNHTMYCGRIHCKTHTNINPQSHS